MKPIPFNMKGTEYALTIKIATYPEGNLAIKLYQESFGQLVFWDSLTVNLAACVPRIVDLSIPSPPANDFMPGSSEMDWGNAPARSGWKTAWNMWNTSSTPKS